MATKINVDISFNLTQDQAINRKIFDHILEIAKDKPCETSVSISFKGLSVEQVWGIKEPEKKKEQAADNFRRKNFFGARKIRLSIKAPPTQTLKQPNNHADAQSNSQFN